MQQFVYDSNPHFLWRHTRENRNYGSLANTTHYDDSMIITYLIRGSGHIWVEGNNTQIREGDLLLLNPREFHRCFFDSHPKHERLSIYINRSIAQGFSVPQESLFSAFDDRPLGKWNVIPSSILQSLQINSLLEEMQCPAKNDYDAEVLLQCQVCRLLIRLKQAVALAQNQPSLSSANKTVSLAIEYINGHLTEDLSTYALSAALFVDSSYLCRTFKKYTNATLSDYISKKRIDLAQQLMENGMSCTEACFKSGFNNYSSFYKYYRKYKGENPNVK